MLTACGCSTRSSLAGMSFRSIRRWLLAASAQRQSASLPQGLQLYIHQQVSAARHQPPLRRPQRQPLGRRARPEVLWRGWRAGRGRQRTPRRTQRGPQSRRLAWPGAAPRRGWRSGCGRGSASLPTSLPGGLSLLPDVQLLTDEARAAEVRSFGVVADVHAVSWSGQVSQPLAAGQTTKRHAMMPFEHAKPVLRGGSMAAAAVNIYQAVAEAVAEVEEC